MMVVRFDDVLLGDVLLGSLLSLTCLLFKKCISFGTDTGGNLYLYCNSQYLLLLMRLRPGPFYGFHC